MSQCTKCESEISETASKCPDCGFEPAKNGHMARVIALFVGIILTMTVVGSVIGIPLIGLAVYGEKKSEDLTPANPTR